MRVGLTGGIASGKSTVSSILRELGAVGLDLLREELQRLPIPKKRIELACRLHVRGSTGERRP